ncbi:hypothetical protein [Paucilactobacillus nenjiangensis]|uniref:hypothetical protein n=1 Tax=Paucilactobacillus nenjiangensis TaxID=1296540 RepID=UPI003BB4ED31
MTEYNRRKSEIFNATDEDFSRWPINTVIDRYDDITETTYYLHDEYLDKDYLIKPGDKISVASIEDKG